MPLDNKLFSVKSSIIFCFQHKERQPPLRFKGSLQAEKYKSQYLHFPNNFIRKSYKKFILCQTFLIFLVKGELDSMNYEVGKLHRKVAKIRKTTKEKCPEQIKNLKNLRIKAKIMKERYTVLDQEFQDGLRKMPNCVDSDTPQEQTALKIQKIVKNTQKLDFKRGEKVTSHPSSYFLLGIPLIKHLANQQKVLFFFQKEGFLVYQTPLFIKKSLYKRLSTTINFEIKDKSLVLANNSVIPLMLTCQGEFYKEEQLPVKQEYPHILLKYQRKLGISTVINDNSAFLQQEEISLVLLTTEEQEKFHLSYLKNLLEKLLRSLTIEFDVKLTPVQGLQKDESLKIQFVGNGVLLCEIISSKDYNSRELQIRIRQQVKQRVPFQDNQFQLFFRKQNRRNLYLLLQQGYT